MTRAREYSMFAYLALGKHLVGSAAAHCFSTHSLSSGQTNAPITRHMAVRLAVITTKVASSRQDEETE